MTEQDKSTQLRVGIFVALGLGAIAAMVVYFGRLGDAARQYYPITVEYANASGIYKDVYVLLAGAKVGMVESSPQILPDMNGVSVKLNIYENVHIPSKSTFQIGSSGLLGDKFIEIILDKDAKGSPPIAPGSVIKGKSESGFGEIMEKAPAILAEVKEAVANIKSVTGKLDSDVFKESTLANLNKTMENLKETSATFAESSKKIDALVEKADGVVGSSKDTIDSFKATAESYKKTSEDLQKAIADVRNLLQQAKDGRGALGVLLSDKQVAENLKALVANLKRYGILWYKDRPVESAPGR